MASTRDRPHTQREYEDLSRRLRDGQSRPLSETDIAHARPRAAIRERLEAPYAGRDYQDELRRQENDLVALMRGTGHPVNLRSRNKRYTFWLHEKGDRLLVKVGWLGGRQRAEGSGSSSPSSRTWPRSYGGAVRAVCAAGTSSGMVRERSSARPSTRRASAS